MSRLDRERMTARDYERTARAYLQSLPKEHFMESTTQGTQREITLESLALLRVRRPDVHVYNELLVQYWHKGRLRQVVPDNMVVLSSQPVRTLNSYNLELEPARPFWVLEYVSASNLRKDYTDSRRKYEKELRVPYFLLFYAEQQDLRWYRYEKGGYQPTLPNLQGRLPLAELDLELGLHDGWVRYWHAGQLLELPGDLLQRVEQLQGQVEQANQRAHQEHEARL